MGKIKTNKEFENIAILIEEARNRAFSKVNEELIILYFEVGNIVSAKVTAGVWGEHTVADLAGFIQLKFPGLSGFTRRGLYRMKQFYEVYASLEFVKPIATQLETWFAGNKENVKVSALPTQIQTAKAGSKKVSAVPTQSKRLKALQQKLAASLLCKVTWTNHLEILSQTKSPEEKLFYLLHCIKEKWSMRDLRRQLSSGYFERTMLSSQIAPAGESQLPQNFFKDPYIFEFLDLPDGHSETDLEKALVLNLQKFILEIGKGFTYMGNQFRLQVGNKDYRSDLLFYHRDLQSLVLFELKIQ
ncbi:MAG: PDDEXK nuclease domain-containing protein, partial [Ferruginibacter sp.]